MRKSVLGLRLLQPLMNIEIQTLKLYLGYH